MKKVLILLMIFSGIMFGNQYTVLKIQDRVTNELVEKSEKDFQGYKEWLKEEDKKWLKAEKNNPRHSKISPRLNNPDISYEEYREKGYLGNWLIWQVDIEDTIWGKLITVPSPESKECYGKYIENKEQRLDFIKETSRGYKILPDEWISSLELEYINSACKLNSLILKPNKDKNKLRAEVERIKHKNEGLGDNSKASFDGLGLLFFMLILAWFFAFIFEGIAGRRADSMLFNIVILKWLFK